MNGASIGLDVLAWLLTYAVHSTLLLAAAWWWTARSRSSRVRETVWKTAFVGGVLTATLQVGLGVEPFAGTWRLESATTAMGVEPARAEAEDERAPLAGPRVPTLDLAADPGVIADNEPLHSTTIAAPMEVVAADSVYLVEPPLQATHERLATGSTWTRWAIGVWLGGGVLLALLFLRAWLALLDRLARRRPLEHGPLPGLVALLRRKAGVRRPIRLAVSPRLSAPIAMGTVFPQIVVPPRALDELPHDMQESMLAHEIAHIARYDPLWFSFSRLIETVLFFQPLNRLAARKIRECAELRCDGLAVEYTQNPIALARCLAEVAKWIVHERRALPACGMTGLSSPLGERVERILDAESDQKGSAWPHAASSALLAVTTLVVPGFSSTDRPGSSAGLEADADDEWVPELAALPAPEPSVPTRTPTRRTTALAEATVAQFEAALAELESEIDRLRADAGEREVPAHIRADLDAMEQRLRTTRSRNQRIQKLLSAIALREGGDSNERDRKEDR